MLLIISTHVSLGLSRLCSATFKQLLAFGAIFCRSSNLEQNILRLRAHVKHEKVNVFISLPRTRSWGRNARGTPKNVRVGGYDFIGNFTLWEFLKCQERNVNSSKCASNTLKLSFKLFFLTNFSNYCEERKIIV